MKDWRNFYEACSEQLDREHYLVVYLDATNPEAVQQVLIERGYIQSKASNVLGIKLGEFAFSECDLTEYPGEERVVDAIIVYHSLPECWSAIDESPNGLSRKKELVENLFLIPSNLIIDFGYDYLDELEDEARLTYP